MPTPEEVIQETIQELEVKYRKSFAAASTVEELEVGRAGVLGRQGKFTLALRMLGGIQADRRVEFGERLNGLHREILGSYQSRVNEIHALRDANL